jgi:hypothetical protein
MRIAWGGRQVPVARLPDAGIVELIVEILRTSGWPEALNDARLLPLWDEAKARKLFLAELLREAPLALIGSNSAWQTLAKRRGRHPVGQFLLDKARAQSGGQCVACGEWGPLPLCADCEAEKRDAAVKAERARNTIPCANCRKPMPKVASYRVRGPGGRGWLVICDDCWSAQVAVLAREVARRTGPQVITPRSEAITPRFQIGSNISDTDPVAPFPSAPPPAKPSRRERKLARNQVNVVRGFRPIKLED